LQGQVNLGGQYLTKYREAHSAVFDYLQRTGVIHSFDATSGIIEGVRKEYECLPHYVAPHGMEQIVRAFLSVEEQRHVRLSTHISAINIDSDQLLSVSCVSQDGLSSTIEKVNCLVMTIPPPAMFRHISGNFWQHPAMTTELTAALQAVSYSSRFALALYYRLPSVECERILQEQRWTARYVTDDPHIRYISLSQSTAEPGIASSSTKVSDRLAPASNANLAMLSVLVHSSISLYQDMHLSSNHNDSNDSHNVSSVETNVRSLSQAETGAVSTIMVQSLHRYLPSLQSLTPAYSQLSSWADSQVTVPFPSNFWDSLPSADSAYASSTVKEGIPRHAVCVDVSKEARVIFAGDYFSSSNVEGCLDSAQQTADYILEFLSPSSLGQRRIGHL
jgi:predicted NAD/FAD-dependent oxidoreductase